MGFLTPNATGEHDVLKTFVLQQLGQLRTTIGGLTDEQAHSTPTASKSAPVPPSPWFPKDVTHWEARWCLLHLTAEVARHVGHADLIRETIDGSGAFELNDLAEDVRGDVGRR